MWQTTKEVGCGIANCQVNNRQYVVCQYKPAGNVVNRPMFTQSNLDQFRQHETIEDCYTPDSGSDTASPSDSDTNDSERYNIVSRGGFMVLNKINCFLLQSVS